MNPSDQQAIIARVEQVRVARHLNKSQFAARIGMKPQTYNNFIGAQGSKPNVELLVGLVKVFDVNPLWLLLGGDRSGAMFLYVATSLKSGESHQIPEVPAAHTPFGWTPTDRIINVLGWLRQDIEKLGAQIADFRRAITKEPEAPSTRMEPSVPGAQQG